MVHICLTYGHSRIYMLTYIAFLSFIKQNIVQI